jgi:hypothetical protein
MKAVRFAEPASPNRGESRPVASSATGETGPEASEQLDLPPGATVNALVQILKTDK